MRKKYDKVDLKSDAFKVKKTPQKKVVLISRSPTSKSPNFLSTPSAQKIDPNQLFQKVCCPNCKYLFKIIKNNQLLTQSPQKKKEAKKSVSTQTQQNLATEVKLISKLNSQVNEKLSPRMSQSLIFKSRLIKQNIFKSSQNQDHQHSHIKRQNYSFQERSPFKSSNLHKQREHIAEKQGQLSKSQIANKKHSEINISNPDTNLYKRQLKYSLGDELTTMISQNMRNQKILSYISQFYAQLPSTVQTSAIAKMLFRQCQQIDQKHSFA